MTLTISTKERKRREGGKDRRKKGKAGEEEEKKGEERGHQINIQSLPVS